MTTVRKDVLSKAIADAAKAISTSPVLPLLANVLFESNNGSSRVAGTNLEIGISCVFPSSGEGFKVCIPAKVISSLVDALHADEVELELDPANQSIMVATDSSTSNIRCVPADEFPDIPTVTQASFTLPVAQFKEMIQRVAFASDCKPNASGPLTGVQLSIEGKKLVMFAVDGYHFSYEDTILLAIKRRENIPFVVKGATLEIISRILPDDGILAVQVEGNRAMFHCGDVDVTTQLVDGQFPDYKKLEDALAPPQTTIVVSTMDLMRAARQLRVFASETGATKLDMKGMLFRYSVAVQDKGDSAITFAAIKKGKDIEVGVNVNLLHELLEVCKTEYITVEMVDNRSPILFKMKGFGNFYHVIMPIVL